MVVRVVFLTLIWTKNGGNQELLSIVWWLRHSHLDGRLAGTASVADLVPTQPKCAVFAVGNKNVSFATSLLPS